MADCTGRCLTGADIGVPEYGNAFYAVDPDCDEHGTPMSPEEEEMAPPDPWNEGPQLCPCAEFSNSGKGICACGHLRKWHELSPDQTSYWCTRVTHA